MNRTRRRGNRLGLGLVGLLLTVLGGLALARGLRAMPQNWAPANEPLVNGPVREVFFRFTPWIWWLVALAAVVVALLGLRWLAVQGRRSLLRSLRVDGGPGGVTEVSAGGVADAMAADVAASPAVISASAALTGTEKHPEVRLRLVADEESTMNAIREHLAGVAIPHMRTALDTDHVPAIAKVTLRTAPEEPRVLR